MFLCIMIVQKHLVKKPEFRGAFDYVTARAVAQLNVLSELCLPLVKKEGYFLAFLKASKSEEINEAKPAIATLGGQFQKEVGLLCVRQTNATLS